MDGQVEFKSSIYFSPFWNVMKNTPNLHAIDIIGGMKTDAVFFIANRFCGIEKIWKNYIK